MRLTVALQTISAPASRAADAMALLHNRWLAHSASEALQR
jgi:hypothetical protein